MSTGTITAAQRDEVVQIQDRDFQRWTVAIDVGDKTVNADVLRLPDSPDPTGQPAYSEEKNGRVRWKVGSGAFGGGGGATSGGGSSRGYGKSPEEQKAIQRQHSQEMAIRMVAELRELGLRPDGLDSATAAIAYVKTLTDHFEKDIAS